MIEATRKAKVEGYDIAVFDDLVPMADVQKVTGRLMRSPFTRSETASPELKEHRHFVYETPLDVAQSLSMWRATLDALSTLRPNTEFKPYRAYINHAAYGDMLFTHFDAQPQHQDFFTALWYLCDAWDVEWGGETMFFDERGDALVAVTPRPGRLALFDGRIRHAGRPPNRVHYGPRYTFALKLAPANAFASIQGEAS